jgi:hypothetical protein
VLRDLTRGVLWVVWYGSGLADFKRCDVAWRLEKPHFREYFLDTWGRIVSDTK